MAGINVGVDRYLGHSLTLDAHTRDLVQTLITGQYYHQTLTHSSGVNYTIAANRLYAVPFLVGRALTVDRIAIFLVTAGAAGKKARLGIYKDGTNMYPGTLVLDAGTVDVDGAGSTLLAITISQALTKGLHWLVLVSDGAPVVGGMYVAAAGQHLLTGVQTNLSSYNGCWYVAFTYAALPDPFTAAGSFLGGEQPTIAVRILTLD